MHRSSLFTSLFLVIGSCLPFGGWGQDFTTPFEKDPNYSAAYAEVIQYYEQLVAAYPRQLRMVEFGRADVGKPLQLVVLSMNGEFDPAALRAQEKRVLFVNNGIHPGEPCGIDASMMLVRDLLRNPEQTGQLLDSTVLVIVPVYNIGGALNRGSYSRANQNGPKAHGFRGNAKNLDLNRDFIKCDSRNAQAFNQAFADWQPDVFIDNHTSNGADYSYTLTMIATQSDKLGGPLATYQAEQMLPWLYQEMAQRGWEMTPYVNTNDVRARNFGFLDLPRYSSGYAALHHTLSFIPEAHMLKPFADRVQSVYTFMRANLEWLSREGATIRQLRDRQRRAYLAQERVPINWGIDTNSYELRVFKGYEPERRPSAVTGLERLHYNRDRPFEDTIRYYNTFVPTLQVSRPSAYIIPQAYQQVIDRLRWNGVEIEELAADTIIEVEQYYIRDFQTRNAPYEGHYLHSNIQVDTVRRTWTYYQGDAYVSTDQPAVRYILETLEPQAPDGFFAWNFFDGILMQKEYFSAYVFEDLAATYLEAHPEVRRQFEQKRAADEGFAKSARAQLDFIYRQTPYYEKTHRLYPVARVP